MNENGSVTCSSASIENGERFAFGENWSRFLSVLNKQRIEEAKCSLTEMLNVESLEGKSFLDVGSGSGLYSLAARMLGARVHSFDYDPLCVACTSKLKQRYFPEDMEWIVESGSALDAAYLERLGKFDIVYSWGVLHHTGSMWSALRNMISIVNYGGSLFISIYNDQGRASRRWKFLKRLYNECYFLRIPLTIYTLVRQWSLTFIRDTTHGRPLASWNNYTTNRGMSAWHDVVDWIGGYPFEVAKPEEVFEFYRSYGFQLERLKSCAGGLGCNQFVFSLNDFAASRDLRSGDSKAEGH